MRNCDAKNRAHPRAHPRAFRSQPAHPLFAGRTTATPSPVGELSLSIMINHWVSAPGCASIRKAPVRMVPFVGQDIVAPKPTMSKSGRCFLQSPTPGPSPLLPLSQTTLSIQPRPTVPKFDHFSLYTPGPPTTEMSSKERWQSDCSFTIARAVLLVANGVAQGQLEGGWNKSLYASL